MNMTDIIDEDNEDFELIDVPNTDKNEELRWKQEVKQMNEEILEPIRPFEPETNFNQMDYLKQFIVQGKRKSEFSSFVRKLNKKK